MAAGVSSQSKLDQANNVFNNASQNAIATQQAVGNVLAQLDNHIQIPINQHPSVQQAIIALKQAQLNLSYTTVKAPIDGILSQVENIQKGDYLTTGTPVFSLISTHDIWVGANFKETQLNRMKPGQKAFIHIDAYPNQDFIGHVASQSPGTGSIFSLLPPENATGNWVKIVQRVPVRIAIDNRDNLAIPSGLSATVTVDIGYHSS